jgi:hypothetical protein
VSALPQQPFATTTRHGRAADALIASYVRELLEDDGIEAPSAAQEQRADPVAATPPALADGLATDATL